MYVCYIDRNHNVQPHVNILPGNSKALLMVCKHVDCQNMIKILNMNGLSYFLGCNINSNYSVITRQQLCMACKQIRSYTN